MPDRLAPLRQEATYRSVQALLRALAFLPWEARLDVAGAIGRLAMARSPRLRGRVHANLAHVLPEIPPAERARIARGVGDCFGRTALELFAARDFLAAAPWNPPAGPGLAEVEAAMREGSGLVLVSGHYGGWDAIRGWARARGAPCATVYRPIKNPRLDRLYHASVSRTGGPVLPKERLAVRGLVKHLARGGIIALLVDQYERRVPMLDFLGRPAPTTTVPASMALKFRVPLVPVFATRTEDGRRIDIAFERPIPHTDPDEMMQAVNDRLGAWIRRHPDQYYWLHRRWSKRLPGALR